jgi:RNA polymerase-binding transcription factor DksA
MSQEEKTAYSHDELREFEDLIRLKISLAKEELNLMKDILSKKNDSGTDFTASTSKLLEDGADTLERESMNQLAARQQKFIINLENALIRIKNGTYGLCVDTGKLISRDRLMAVPHTMHSIEAKLAKK